MVVFVVGPSLNDRYRPKGVFGKGVGNSQNSSEMRQKCVKMGLVLLGKEERPKCVRNPSKLRQKCVKNARNTFGGEHLLDDTEMNFTVFPGDFQGVSGHFQGVFPYALSGMPFGRFQIKRFLGLKLPSLHTRICLKPPLCPS